MQALLAGLSMNYAIVGSYLRASFSAPGGVYHYDGKPMGSAAPVDLTTMQCYREEFGGMLGELETSGEIRP